MTSKKIELIDIDPVEIFGINNKLLYRMQEYFPELKIVARGSGISVSGKIDEIDRFEEMITQVTDLTSLRDNLNENDIDNIAEKVLEGRSKSEKEPKEREDEQYVILHGNEGRVVRARTQNQKKLVDQYYKNDLLFALGPAGTGKTYTAIALAVRALKNREVKKLILTRPAVEAGERLGFLPGDMKEKLDPYLQPLYDALRDMIQAKRLQSLMEEGIIQIAPLAYMRGRTLDSAFVILDEAQNTSLGQLKMFLTRMGCNAKFIVTGDATQIDLPNKKDSGLLRGIEIVKNIQGISIINFSKEDIVRHPLVTKIVNAFEESESGKLPSASGAASTEATAAEATETTTR